jgi:methylated-DNA-[protein]-cysteine S-methyltransferase
MNEMFLYLDRLPTQIGELVIVCDAQGQLRAVDWTDHEHRWRALIARHYGSGVQLCSSKNPHGLTSAFAAYFEGDCAVLDKLPASTNGTAFQRKVWQSLRSIPAGQTWSYGQLAEYAGSPKAVRAVGAANGSNPVGIVLPCHRVIGADGALTGYGGGLTRKQWLLEHERRYAVERG